MPFAHAVFGLVSLLAVQTPEASSQAQKPPPNLPVSLSRIRESLNRPVTPRLTVPRPQAEFSVEILEKQRFEDLLTLLGLGGGSPMPGVLFGSASSRPSSTADLSVIGRTVGKKVVEARKKRAERLAREEVQRGLIEFCTLHECLPRKQ